MSHAFYFYHDVKAQTVQTVLTRGVYKLQSFKTWIQEHFRAGL